MKALAALKQESEFVDKISTWPWHTDTIRGLGTAILLPAGLWFITRMLESVIRF